MFVGSVLSWRLVRNIQWFKASKDETPSWTLVSGLAGLAHMPAQSHTSKVCNIPTDPKQFKVPESLCQELVGDGLYSVDFHPGDQR